jgi:hypothetical protein
MTTETLFTEIRAEILDLESLFAEIAFELGMVR